MQTMTQTPSIGSNRFCGHTEEAYRQAIENCGYICNRDERLACNLNAIDIASKQRDKNFEFLISGLNRNPFDQPFLCQLPKKLKPLPKK